MELPDFLTRATDGDIRLTGHRIGLFHVVQYYNDGESAEMLGSRYPTLPLALVHKVIAFYLENQTDVDAYVATCTTKLDQKQAISPPLPLSDLRQRLSDISHPTAR